MTSTQSNLNVFSEHLYASNQSRSVEWKGSSDAKTRSSLSSPDERRGLKLRDGRGLVIIFVRERILFMCLSLCFIVIYSYYSFFKFLVLFVGLVLFIHLFFFCLFFCLSLYNHLSYSLCICVLYVHSFLLIIIYIYYFHLHLFS